MARLRALVRRGAQERTVIREVGALTLHLVTRARTAVAQTTREFAVLHLLMRHLGDVVSRAEILDNVWTLPTKAATTLWRSTSFTCVTRSTHHSTSSLSRRSADAGTGCAPSRQNLLPERHWLPSMLSDASDPAP